MSRISRFSLIVAVNDRQVLNDNLFASPCLQGECDFDLFLQEGFHSAAAAYNDAVDRAQSDLLIFVHQDVLLPQHWLNRLGAALAQLERTDDNWGVLGCSGVTADGEFHGRVYTSGVGVFGRRADPPASVQTLDEIVLIFRKSSGLRFDAALPGFHLYGTDICLRAANMGRLSYAFDGFCIHNTNQTIILPDEFYRCCEHIRRGWREYLPIRTTCVQLTRLNMPIRIRKIREFYLRNVRRKKLGGLRNNNVNDLMRELSKVN